jgi:hypothetical protein
MSHFIYVIYLNAQGYTLFCTREIGEASEQWLSPLVRDALQEENTLQIFDGTSEQFTQKSFLKAFCLKKGESNHHRHYHVKKAEGLWQVSARS